MPDTTGNFGIVRWRVKSGKPAFSPDLADWTNGRFLTDTDTPNKGVLDAAVSPDGKRLALISNQGSSAFQLWLADDPQDFAMSSAKRDAGARLQGVVAQRQQGAADRPGRRAVPGGCRGRAARVRSTTCANPKELNVAGDDPSFQPLTVDDGVNRRAVPQLSSPARAGSELLRQLWDAAERLHSPAGARSGRCDACPGRR